MFTSRGGLAVAQLIFYLPALVLAIAVSVRQGFGRQAGWMLLCFLAIVRIIGSICELIAQDHPSVTVIEIFAILQSVGLSPLLLAMTGMLKRLQEGLGKQRTVSPRILNLLGLILMTALILAIVGGTSQFKGGSTSPPSGSSTLSRVAIIMFIIVFVLQSGITLITFFSFRSIIPGDERIIIAIACSIPFLLVRLIYSVLSIFTTNSNFNPVTGNVVVQGFMAVMEEFIVVILFLSAGLLAPKIERRQVQQGRYAGDAESARPGAHESESFKLMLPSQYIRNAMQSRR